MWAKQQGGLPSAESGTSEFSLWGTRSEASRAVSEGDGAISFRLPRQPRTVLLMRAFTLACIMAAAALCGAFAYVLLRAADVGRFERDYENMISNLEDALKRATKNLADVAEITASEIAMPPGSQVIIAGFQSFEAWARENADNQFPVDETVPSWATGLARSRYKSGFLTASANFSSDTGIADWVVLKPTNEADLPTWNLGYYKAYGPVMQGYPLDRTAASIMLEGSNIPERVDLMREMLAWRSSGATGLSISAQDVYQQIVRPVTAFASLIFYRPPGAAANESIVTGSVFFNFLWETYLSTLLSDRTEMQVVLFSPTRNFNFSAVGMTPADTSHFTFRVRSNEVQSVGWGDLHRQQDVVSGGYSRTIDVRLGVSVFQLTVYPCQPMFDGYMTELPRVSAIGSVLIIVGIGAFFAAFDFFSRRHYLQIYRASAIASTVHSVAQEKMRGRHAFVSMARHSVPPRATALLAVLAIKSSADNLLMSIFPRRLAGALDVLHSTPLSEAQHELLSTIRMGSGTILSLVEDALNVGFEGTGQFTVTPVLCNPRLEVLERSWSVVNLQKRYAEKVRSIKMTIDIAPNVPEMSLLDASRACQVLTNLLGNAVKFVPDQTGSVTMSCTYSKEDEMLRCEVRDNGRGLSPEGMSRLFRPFQQAEGDETKRAFGGTGLGLVICRDIVQAMGGDLTVSSPGIGLGCTFAATLHVVDLTPSPAVLSRRGSGPTTSLLTAAESFMAFSPGFSEKSAKATEKRRGASDHAVHVAVAVTADRDCRRGSLERQRSAQPPSTRRADISATGSDDKSFGQGTPKSARSSRLSIEGIFSKAATGRGGKPERKATFGALQEEIVAAAADSLRVRALVAEDDQLVRRVLKMTLKMAGLEATLVEDGVLLTDLLEKDPAGVDIFLLDSNMGGGEKDGVPTIRRIKAIFDSCGKACPPIVVLSGETDTAVVAGLVAAGATRVLTKPASLAELKTLAALANSSSAAERVALRVAKLRESLTGGNKRESDIQRESTTANWVARTTGESSSQQHSAPPLSEVSVQI